MLDLKKKKQVSVQPEGCSLLMLYRSEATFEPFYMRCFNLSQHNMPAGTTVYAGVKLWSLKWTPRRDEWLKTL